MKKIFVLLICLLATSCATVSIGVTNKNLTFEKYVNNYVLVRHVEFSIPDYELGKGDPIEKYFEKELKRYGGDAVINVRFQLVPGLFSNELKITGDIVSYKVG